MAKKNKPNKLAASASRKLASIGVPKFTTRDLAHALYHLQQDGRAERLQMPDGSFAWRVPGNDGEPGLVPETPELLSWLDRFEADPSLHQH